MTKIIDKKNIKEGADFIKAGELVAFPTETVYGLGADGLNPDAVAKIFHAKKRPADNPLILHIADKKDLEDLVLDINEKAKILIEAFWPGPISFIFKAKSIVPDIVTAGGKTVAIRMPANDIALELIKESKTPIAAPSANLSGSPSPTDAKAVYEDMKGRIPLIIDGGSTNYGLESTVIDISSDSVTLLRPGFITKEDIESLIGKIAIDSYLKDENEIPKSPGQKYRHYAPKAKVFIYEKREDIINGGFILAFDDEALDGDIKIGKREDLSFMASKLFHYFREADRLGEKKIFVPKVEKKGWGFAIMNRLEKAVER